MNDTDYAEVFTEDDIITREEFMMLFSKVFDKIVYIRLMMNMVPLAKEHIDGDVCDDDFKVTLFVMCRDHLRELVGSKNPKMAVYDITTRLHEMSINGEALDWKETLPGGREKINSFGALIMYVILYYRFRLVDDYATYILPALYDCFSTLVSAEDLTKIQKRIEALPMHEERNEAEAQLDGSSADELREMLMHERSENARLTERISRLEQDLQELSDLRDDNDEAEQSGRWYKRKAQIVLLLTLMDRAGLRIANSKTATAIMMANLLHLPNFRKVQKLLSGDLYLRAADHREACAEINGLLAKLAAPFRLEVRLSQKATSGEKPADAYSEILKSYKNTGE